VTPGASEDGSAMIAYNADSGALMGTLYHYPATEGRGGEMRHVYDWDSGVSKGCM
jgi:dipeptidase